MNSDRPIAGRKYGCFRCSDSKTIRLPVSSQERVGIDGLVLVECPACSGKVSKSRKLSLKTWRRGDDTDADDARRDPGGIYRNRKKLKI